MPRKMLQTWPGQADKNFQGRTKIFSTVAENFYPRIKIFGGKFFLDRPLEFVKFGGFGTFE